VVVPPTDETETEGSTNEDTLQAGLALWPFLSAPFLAPATEKKTNTHNTRVKIESVFFIMIIL
jgi:hypothetical protein